MLMLKKISAVKVRQNLGEIMNEVAFRNDQYIIERGGKPLVAIVPVWQLEKWLKQREAFFRNFEEIREKNKKFSPEEIEKDVEEAVRAVRAKGRKERKKKSHKRK